MTAMPPTMGHLKLVQFARILADGEVIVIFSTQPDEPMSNERASSFKNAIKHNGLLNVRIEHRREKIEQDPSKPGFWDMWKSIMFEYGITKNDYIVASEPYGQKLAEITGAQFFPYDIDRTITKVKATPIRNNPIDHFSEMIPEFRPYLRTTVTVFGAESTGKTTLSKMIAKEMNSSWIFEYARPYLENTVNEITIRSMTSIWKGQAALQRHIENISDSSIIIQDTDLFSTVGYWEFPHWQKKLKSCPIDLIQDAIELKSDLYIVTQSNIPFEKDPLRYGGNKREGSDKYWINICEKYELPYVLLDDADPEVRLTKAKREITKIVNKKVKLIAYDRRGL